MVRYFYEWTPLLFIGAVGLLVLPGLALIALVVFAFVGVAALAWPIFVVSSVVGRAVGDRWQGRSDESPATGAALVPVALRARSLPTTRREEP